MPNKNEKFDFNEDILEPKKYLIINRALDIPVVKWLKKSYYLFKIVTNGVIYAFIIPIIISIIPALINLTDQQWLYGVFLTVLSAIMIWTKYIARSKINLLKSIRDLLEHIESTGRSDNKFKLENLKKQKKLLKKDASLICNGTIRNLSSNDWVASAIHLLTICFFMVNPQINLFSMEYLYFVINITLAIFDHLLGGFLGSFNELTVWVPQASQNLDTLDSFIIGILRFCILIMMTKIIIKGINFKLSQKVWFEGNDLGLTVFVDKYMNDFIEYEGSLIIYDFGNISSLGEQQAKILFNKEFSRRSEKLLDDLVEINTGTIKKTNIRDHKYKFYEIQTGNLHVTNNNYFHQGSVFSEVFGKEKRVCIYFHELFLLSHVDQVIYNTNDQKLYFVNKAGDKEDSGLLILFGNSLLVAGMTKIEFKNPSSNEILSFPLKVSGNDKYNLFFKKFF